MLAALLPVAVRVNVSPLQTGFLLAANAGVSLIILICLVVVYGGQAPLVTVSLAVYVP